MTFFCDLTLIRIICIFIALRWIDFLFFHIKKKFVATKCKAKEINYSNVFINLSPLPLMLTTAAGWIKTSVVCNCFEIVRVIYWSVSSVHASFASRLLNLISNVYHILTLCVYLIHLELTSDPTSRYWNKINMTLKVCHASFKLTRLPQDKIRFHQQ